VRLVVPTGRLHVVVALAYKIPFLSGRLVPRSRLSRIRIEAVLVCNYHRQVFQDHTKPSLAILDSLRASTEKRAAYPLFSFPACITAFRASWNTNHRAELTI
jgi:hypothetical protein